MSSHLIQLGILIAAVLIFLAIVGLVWARNKIIDKFQRDLGIRNREHAAERVDGVILLSLVLVVVIALPAIFFPRDRNQVQSVPLLSANLVVSKSMPSDADVQLDQEQFLAVTEGQPVYVGFDLATVKYYTHVGTTSVMYRQAKGWSFFYFQWGDVKVEGTQAIYTTGRAWYSWVLLGVFPAIITGILLAMIWGNLNYGFSRVHFFPTKKERGTVTL